MPKKHIDVPEVKGWVPFNAEKKKSKIQELKDKKIEKIDFLQDWKDKPITKEEGSNVFGFCQSSKSFKYANALDVYFEKCLGKIKQILSPYGLAISLDRLQGEITVMSTRKAFDPVVVLKGNLFAELICRYVPLDEAAKVLEDDYSGEIIYIPDGREKYKERLQDDNFREMFAKCTNSKIFIHGKTVSIVGLTDGAFEGGNILRDILLHKKLPFNTIRRYELTKYLRSQPELAGEDWSKYYACVESRKKNVQRKNKKIKKDKDRSAFPPPQPLSKIDKMLEDGTFHLKYKKEVGKKYFKPIEKLKKANKRVYGEDESTDEPKTKKSKIRKSQN